MISEPILRFLELGPDTILAIMFIIFIIQGHKSFLFFLVGSAFMLIGKMGLPISAKFGHPAIFVAGYGWFYLIGVFALIKEKRGSND